jgi:hypothetical protein
MDAPFQTLRPQIAQTGSVKKGKDGVRITEARYLTISSQLRSFMPEHGSIIIQLLREFVLQLVVQKGPDHP